jgi:uncharacterized protein (TIGR03437 family)
LADVLPRAGARRTLALIFIFVGYFLAPPLAQGQPNVLGSLGFDPIAGGLEFPVAITHAGDGSNRLFVTLQRGRVLIHNGAELLPDAFLDIRPRVSCCGERGLLSIAFHPNFEANGFFFVNYTNVDGNTVVSRFHASSNSNVADPESETILLMVEQPFSNHNGGQLQFGPDGFLYIGMGDGGSAGDPGNRAQNLGTRLGKILRIDVNQGSPYSIPPNNPFAATAGARPEIWALGLRNPWRFSFDRQTGDLFIGDVGQDTVEEIDFQPAASTGGENYGWRVMEGSRCFNPSSGCQSPGFTAPILEYSHGSGGICGGSVSGGYRYRGLQFPQLSGIYFYADYCRARLYAASENGGRWSAESPRQVGFSITTFGEDEAGELYFADHANGAVYRITANHPSPSLLSLFPAGAMAGAAGFSLTVTGANFVPGAEVHWNGSARATIFISSSQLQAVISAADIAAAGSAQVSVFNPPPGGGLAQAIVFEISAAPGVAPLILPGGVVDAAGYKLVMGLAPGTIAAVFGERLSSRTEAALTAPLPELLGEAKLVFGNILAAPIFFASPGQMNVQIPWELQGVEAVLSANVAGVNSPAVTVPLAAFSPGLFSMDGSGSGQGAIQIVGTGGALAAPARAFNLPQPSRPARRGEFLSIFATGLGPVTNTPPTGAATPLTPLSETPTAPSVTIGGISQKVTFHGLTPTAVALYQVNLEVVAGTPGGAQVPVALTIGGKISNTVTVAIE